VFSALAGGSKSPRKAAEGEGRCLNQQGACEAERDGTTAISALVVLGGPQHIMQAPAAAGSSCKSLTSWSSGSRPCTLTPDGHIKSCGAVLIDNFPRLLVYQKPFLIHVQPCIHEPWLILGIVPTSANASSVPLAGSHMLSLLPVTFARSPVTTGRAGITRGTGATQNYLEARGGGRR
jgi:hypothetical protein